MKPKQLKKVPTINVNSQFNRLLQMAKTTVDYKKQLTIVRSISFSINPVKLELYYDFQ